MTIKCGRYLNVLKIILIANIEFADCIYLCTVNQKNECK